MGRLVLRLELLRRLGFLILSYWYRLWFSWLTVGVGTVTAYARRASGALGLTLGHTAHHHHAHAYPHPTPARGVRFDSCKSQLTLGHIPSICDIQGDQLVALAVFIFIPRLGQAGLSRAKVAKATKVTKAC